MTIAGGGAGVLVGAMELVEPVCPATADTRIVRARIQLDI
jgi:hypothetical protein